jgi:hypothetical protein
MDDITEAVAIQQHISRVENLAEALRVEKTPPACNGFAILMKDSTLLMLEGENIRMAWEQDKRKELAAANELLKQEAKKAKWNWSKTAAVLGGTLITNTAVVVSILEIVKAVADKS